MTEHGIKYCCVMVPHTVEGLDDMSQIHTEDLGDEETSQGFFRSAVHVICECGEEFTGYETAQRDYTKHIEQVE